MLGWLKKLVTKNKVNKAKENLSKLELPTYFRMRNTIVGSTVSVFLNNTTGLYDVGFTSKELGVTKEELIENYLTKEWELV